MCNTKCSCTRRDKEKCIVESSTQTGKVCVKYIPSLILTSDLDIDLFFDKLEEEIKKEKWKQYKKDHCSRFDELMKELYEKYPDEMEEARLWALEFLYPKALEDNLTLTEMQNIKKDRV